MDTLPGRPPSAASDRLIHRGYCHLPTMFVVVVVAAVLYLSLSLSLSPLSLSLSFSVFHSRSELNSAAEQRCLG